MNSADRSASMLPVGLLLIFVCGCDPQSARMDNSLYYLIAHPERRIGDEMMVSGFLSDFGGHPKLYPTQDDAEISNLDAEFTIFLEPEQLLRVECLDRFVGLTGRFNGGGFDQIQAMGTLPMKGSPKLSHISNCLVAKN